MIPTTNPLRRQPDFLRITRNPVKLTALLYLREALLQEKYEQCPEFIAVAREFGAQSFEIDELLEDPRRTPFEAKNPPKKILKRTP